jgi:hypothetical protein
MRNEQAEQLEGKGMLTMECTYTIEEWPPV